AAQPNAGRYHARPAPVLACGGLAGTCRVLQIEGTLDLRHEGPFFPGASAVVTIAGSDLRLVPVQGDAAAMPFPAPPPDLQLTALVPGAGPADVTLVSPAGAAQTVELELWLAEPGSAGETFLLRGRYDEGCCDRFSYEIGGVLFDWAAIDTDLRLLDGAFAVTVDWQDHQGGSGAGTPVAFDERSGRFWFFRPDNPELLVKVVDACVPFGRWWFFAAGLTDVGVEIRVEGPAAPGVRTYRREAGQPFQPILDTDAFLCAPPP
ncbi:MAG TPA: hypothetical protein VHM02_04830, partial [Thermoanaerobaculia bacterium]|nr:hypothetical protein [Thermoanaerobaculia bacterium]